MIEIHCTPEHEWSIVYRLEGVRCTEVVTKDLVGGLVEVAQKMKLDMGLAKGQTFMTYPGRGV